jgi:DNA-binding PadR family transcriptional regulator
LKLKQHGWISTKWAASSTGRRVKIYAITTARAETAQDEEIDWHRAAGILSRFFKLSKDAL